VGRKALAGGEVETQARAGDEERRVSADGAAAEVAALLEGLG
jgi:hypothetical protein